MSRRYDDPMNHRNSVHSMHTRFTTLLRTRIFLTLLRVANPSAIMKRKVKTEQRTEKRVAIDFAATLLLRKEFFVGKDQNCSETETSAIKKQLKHRSLETDETRIWTRNSEETITLVSRPRTRPCRKRISSGGRRVADAKNPTEASNVSS